MNFKHLINFESTMIKNVGIRYWLASFFKSNLNAARATLWGMFIWSWSSVPMSVNGKEIRCLALTFCNILHLVSHPEGSKWLWKWRDDINLVEADKYVKFFTTEEVPSSGKSFVKWGFEVETAGLNACGPVVSILGIWHILKYKQSALMYFGFKNSLEAKGRIVIDNEIKGVAL